MSIKSIREEAQFVENIKMKRKARGLPVLDEADIRAQFHEAKKQKSEGGADVNKAVRKGVLSRQRRGAK